AAPPRDVLELRDAAQEPQADLQRRHAVEAGDDGVTQLVHDDAGEQSERGDEADEPGDRAVAGRDQAPRQLGVAQQRELPELRRELRELRADHVGEQRQDEEEAEVEPHRDAQEPERQQDAAAAHARGAGRLGGVAHDRVAGPRAARATRRRATSLASASAAGRASQVAAPSGAASSVPAMTSGIAVNAISPARNAATATSSAALRYVGARPPRSPAA